MPTASPSCAPTTGAATCTCRRAASIRRARRPRAGPTRARPRRPGAQRPRRARARRRDDRVVGILRRGRGVVVVVPREAGFTTPIVVGRGQDGGARDGDLVAARVVRWPSDAHRFVGARVEHALGAAGDLQSETAAILASHGLPTAFPKAVAAAARRLPRDLDTADRRDLRALPLVTIDGERARDFDDAIHVARAGRGFRLTVAVADVAHYVEAGSALDREARARGTSVYFPDRVVPMLPAELSEDRCSLKPGEDRLCQVVELDCDPSGAVTGARFADAVMHSAARLTYPQVRRALVDREDAARRELAGLLASLEAAAELAERLLARRRARGALDFDLPEPEILLDLRGQPEHILRAERSLAHRIVEECMLAANEAVARDLARRGVPSLHRVHEPPAPDAVTALARFLADLGLRLETADGHVTPLALQRVLDAVQGRPEARLVHTVLLRSLSQARYAAEPLGHFGLAAEAYTHFTSPIRRYPDLVVHRLLRRVRRGLGALPDDLAAIAAEASQRERVAVDAERDVVALWRVAAMQARVGEEHAGVVAGIAPFGCFVELTDVFVEGLIHVRDLPPDRWEHDPGKHVLCGRRSGRRLRVVDAVRVVVAAAVPARRHIDLVLAQSELPTPRWSRSRARSRPSS
ncbi:MAG: ribonuclease R [bacterium]|nr:ribonuclease R [bacterium]